MFLQTKSYPVMSGEPHLGSMEETELLGDEYAAHDILTQIWTDGDYNASGIYTFIDDYSEEDIAIDARDYLEWDSVVKYMDSLEETGDQISKEDLFNAAGISI